MSSTVRHHDSLSRGLCPLRNVMTPHGEDSLKPLRLADYDFSPTISS